MAANDTNPTSTGTGTGSRSSNIRTARKRSTVAVNLWKPVAYLLMFIFSPILLISDCFRKKKRVSNEVVFAFSLLLTLVMLFTGTCILVSQSQNNKAFAIVGNFAATQEQLGENLAFSQEISYYALKYNLDPLLVYAVIDQESKFDRFAVSERNAKGLMQLTPTTWQEMNPNGICDGTHDRYQCHETECIFCPGANIAAGTRYLRQLVERFDGEIGFALEAYNAGSTTVDTSRSEHIYPETRSFTRSISQKLKTMRQNRVLDLIDLAISARQALKWAGIVTLGLWFILLAWLIKKL